MRITYEIPDKLYTREGDELWSIYRDYFVSKWGLEKEECEILGCMGKQLFDGEFREHGEEAYKTSIIQPIRNAYHMRFAIANRWPKLKRFCLTPPILDYGCGCGFTLAWLSDMGYKDLYGHEVEGVQTRIVSEMGEALGFQLWQGHPTKFGTILCLNVLEHQHDPKAFLDYLYTLSPNVIANCPLDNDTDTHVASIEAREQCIKLLQEREGYLEGFAKEEGE